MARTKNGLKVLESAVGVLLGIVANLVELLHERGITLEQVALLARPEGKKVLGAIADAVVQALAPVVEVAKDASQFPKWKTIHVGLRKNADEFRKALADAGQKIGQWGHDILGKVVFPSDMVEEEVEFVRVSNAELGLPNGATKEQSEKAALKFGLIKCMPWDGPAIREAYCDQPTGEWLLVMMDPITDSSRYPSVFGLGRYDDGLWLDARNGAPERHWNAGYVWVFRRKVLITKAI